MFAAETFVLLVDSFSPDTLASAFFQNSANWITDNSEMSKLTSGSTFTEYGSLHRCIRQNVKRWTRIDLVWSFTTSSIKSNQLKCVFWQRASWKLYLNSDIVVPCDGSDNSHRKGKILLVTRWLYVCSVSFETSSCSASLLLSESESIEHRWENKLLCVCVIAS